MAACTKEKAPAPLPQDPVLVGVTVVDTRTGVATPDRAIVIERGRIAQVTPARSVPEGGSARVVDGGGRFVVPGYLDMHAHALQSDPERSLTLMLAHGVTGFRQMAGTPERLERRRRGDPLADTDAPQLLAMPGLPLIGPIVRSPEVAVVEVREQQAMGADFIKVADLAPGPFFAALREAHRLGLPFVGHLPSSVDAFEAAKAGMHGIEHLGPNVSLLLGCSTEEEVLRRSSRSSPIEVPAIVPSSLIKRAIPLLQGLLEKKVVANPVLLADASRLDVVRRVLDTYSEEKCLRLANALVRDEVWQVPTLVRVRTTQFADDPSYPADPDLRFVPPATRELWQSLAAEFVEKLSPAHRAMLRELFALQRNLVKLLSRAGVPMMAGSDVGGAQWIVPGIGLHRKFDLLEEARIEPLEVLQMSTLRGAVFLGRESTMGSVEPGKDADLVLLDRDPTESVQNLHAIAAVVRAGRYYDRAALDALKAAAAPHESHR